MNIKALALTSVLALGSIFGAVSPASAGTCWFKNYTRNDGSLSATYCSTSARVNANGHTVWDVVDHKGNEVTIVFWVNNYGDGYGPVELVTSCGVFRGNWWTDRDGDRRIAYNGEEMAIRF